jgi:hypothetical protein
MFANAILSSQARSFKMSRRNLLEVDELSSVDDFEEAVAKGQEDNAQLRHFWQGIKRVVKANQPRTLNEKYYDLQSHLAGRVNSVLSKLFSLFSFFCFKIFRGKPNPVRWSSVQIMLGRLLGIFFCFC